MKGPALTAVMAAILVAAGSWLLALPSGLQAPAADAAAAIPSRDIRLDSAFTSELTKYKAGFRLPEWAAQGRARQIRFDGGPMFAACQFESGWNYLTDPKTPGFVGMIRSVWTLTNLYTGDVERRLDEIKAAGYNWIWASYQLGYSFEDESRQRAQVRRLIHLAHARGIKVTAYFSLTSIFTGSAFVRDPESKNWVQENADGSPVAYSGIPIRLMACVNKPGRTEYLKRIVRLAAEDGADDIFWDSIFNRCHCQHCERGFRAYSKQVLGKEYSIPRKAPAKGKEYGIDENYEFSSVTQGSVDALFAEYGHYAVAKAIAELDRAAKAVKPNILVSANTHRFRYIDAVTDVTWSEDSNRQGGRIDAKGKLTTPIGIYQWAQAVGGGRKPIQMTVAPNDYWELQPPEYYQQTVADAAAFQGNFVMLGSYAFAVRFDDGDPVAKRAWNGISTGLNFVSRNQDLFEHARPVADVAVYYSYPSRLRPDLSKEASIPWNELTQHFMLAGTPTRVLTDDDLVRQGAARLYKENKAIVLAGAACLSDLEIGILNEFTSLGGKLLLTPEAGSFTSFWTKRRATPWNAGSRGVKIVNASELSSPAAVSHLVGGWLGRPPLIRLSGNGYQLGVPVETGGVFILHLVNYDRSRDFKNLRITLSPQSYPAELAAALGRAKTAQWRDPDHSTPEELPITRKGQDFEVVVPDLRVSGILTLSGTLRR